MGQTEAKDKSQVGSIGKQAFCECVLQISKQMITLNCDRIKSATKEKDKECLIAGLIGRRKLQLKCKFCFVFQCSFAEKCSLHTLFFGMSSMLA